MEDENQQVPSLFIEEKVDNPLVTPEKVIRNKRLKRATAQSLFELKSASNPELSPYEVGMQAQAIVDSGYGEDAINAELNAHALEAQQQLGEAVIMGSGYTPQQQAAMLNDIRDLRDYYTDIDGIAKVMQEQRTPDDIETLNVKRAANVRLAQELIARKAEGEDKLDYAINFATSIFNWDYIKDVGDVVDQTLGNEKYAQMINQFKNLPPDMQTDLLPEIVDHIYEKWDNNSVKAAAEVEMLFKGTDAQSSVFWGTAMNIVDFPTAAIGMSVARSAKGLTNLAARAVDDKAIEEAGRIQAAAAADSKIAEFAGIDQADAVRSMDPHNTTTMGNLTDSNNIAGEVNKAVESSNKIVRDEDLPPNKTLINSDTAKANNLEQIELEQALEQAKLEYKAEQIALAGEKPSRGSVKAITKEKEQLTQTLKELKAKRDQISSSAGGTKKSRSTLGTERVAINDQIADIEGKLAHVQRQLDATRGPVAAEGNLSRMQQGLIPEELQKRLDDVKARIAASKPPKASTEAETSQIAQGIVPENMKANVAQEAEKIVAERQAQVKSLSVPAQPLPPAKVGSILPKAAHKVEQIRALMKSILKPDMLTNEREWAAAEKKAIEALQNQLAKTGTELNAVSVIERGSNYIKVKHSTVNGEGDYIYKITEDDIGQTIEPDDLAGFEQSWANHYERVFSPQTLLRPLDDTIVDKTTFAGNQASRIKNRMSQLWREAEAGLSRKKLREVDDVLQLGDEEGVEEFTIAQLRSGSLRTARGNVKFDNRQIEAYYMKRAMYRELHDIQNGILKELLEFEGYAYYTYKDIKGVERNLMGRPKKNFDISDLHVTDKIFFPGDPTRSVHVDAKSIQAYAQKYKDQGYEVIELLEPHYTKEGKKVELALIKKGEGWSKLPDQVLNYSPGYIPRIYRPGYHFVRNEASEQHEVLYAFETKKEAEQWAAEYRKTGGSAGVYADGEFGETARAVREAVGFGGLITGPRKQAPLLVKTATGEQKLKRMSVGQSTERYIANISKAMPLNEYRMAAVKRWINDVTALAKAKDRTGLGGEVRFDTPDDQVNLPKEVKDLMLQNRRYIREVMGVAPQEETITEGIMLGAANLMYGKKWTEPLRDWTLNHSKGSVQSWLKGHAFDMRLGWFNARQLFVQAQNAQIAMLLEPTHALPALGETLKLRAIALLPEDKAIEAAKALGFDKDTIDNLIEYNRSGLKDAIKQNADYEVHQLGIAHNSLDVLRKARKTGRVFYEEGENFSRMVAWNIAKRKWKQQNPNKAIGDREIRDITMDAQGMLMNMQSENAAWWQKAPVIGMATQFMQVQAKFLENVMPKVLGGNTKWTAQQKARVFAGQLFLYGAVGVPMVEEAASYVGMLTGQEPDEFIKNNPDWVTFINEGFVGTVNSVFGGDPINISEGMSLVGGFDETLPIDVLKALVVHLNGGTEDSGFVETLSGPTATTMKRIGDVYSNAILTASALLKRPTLDVAYGAIMSNADTILSMTSTWSNAKKAYVLHSLGRLYDSNGKLVATEQDLGPMGLMNTLRVGMGFKTDLEVLHYATKMSLKERQTIERELKEDMANTMREQMLLNNQALYDAKMAVLSKPLSPTQTIEAYHYSIDQNITSDSAYQKNMKAVEKSLIRSGAEPSVQEMQLMNRGNQ